ncbi:amidohydrolase family protein [Raineyella sp. LH-20]|uniref:amidohydrolase family protein n=1 Tax=Raineyella sp. LH-20 TaxID=3081204 RepID=UPI0029536D53|nr:amidohydrolase family protein [Raineyella sp. LH-20]WOP19540.1 amidohydrolase family protein [Raineyella sp. LH-20]
MSTIDVHAHVIPQEIVEAFRSGDGPDGIRTETVDGQEWVVHRQGYRYPLLPGFYDLEARLTTMHAQGTDAAVLSVAPPLFLYWAHADEAVDAARRINDAIARLGAQAPETFTGLATLPLQDPDAAVAELRRAVTELGLRGAEIGPQAEGVPLDGDALRPVLAAAQELGVPLEIHPYYVGSAPGPLNDFYLTNLQGNPWQTAVSASRLILSGALDQLPTLDLLLVHGGGHLPYQLGRLDHGYRVRPEARTPLHEPSHYARRFHYDTITHSAEATRWLVERVGADRVLYGTDEPFDMAGGSLATQLAAVTDEETRRAIGELNARRLFGLGTTGPAGASTK